MSKPSSEHYRPDIDGLRALAVVPVLLFHARLGCPGGFVGVDVFFVISGYLISSIILKDLKDGTFSLVAFWERRIRRILPALAFVVLACFAAGWLYFLPEDLTALGRSIIAQAALVSNFFFSQQWHMGGGYFAPAVDPKPLLHTWSLAVEEQFYLFFPLLLVLLARYRRLSLTKTLTGITLGSFLLSVIGIDRYPAATFYLLPARAWELLLGALLALTRGRFTPGRRISEASGWLGLGLIGYAVFSYDKYDPFPGAAAVPPCLGAALIIFSGETGFSSVGRILAWKPVVFIGLISYSLYLWHWPLLVFARYPLNRQSPGSSATMLLASVVLAVFTWKYVETPFRKRRVFPGRSRIFWFAGISLMTFLGCGLFVVETGGSPSRYSGRALSYVITRNHFAFRNSVGLEQAQAGSFPEFGTKETNQPVRLLVWGDSHAMALVPVLDELCLRYSWRGVQATHSSTVPALGYISREVGALQEKSPAFNQAVLDYIGKKHVGHVIIAAQWKQYAPYGDLETNLLLTVRAMMDLGVRVYVIKDVPGQIPNLAAKTAFAILHHDDLRDVGISREEHRKAGESLDQMFGKISGMGATVLDPADYFLNPRGFYGMVKDDRVLYTDSHHLSVEGAELLAPLFEPIFKAN